MRKASDLLRMLLIYAIEGTSCRMLAFLGSAMGVANMSDTAWRKALMRSGRFLAWLLGALLGLGCVVKAGNERIDIIDGTNITQEGTKGKQLRIHLRYSLSMGRFEDAKLTDHHTGESLTHFDKYGLVITDAGYGYAGQCIHVLADGGNILTRIYPKTFRLEDETGRPIKIAEHLKGSEMALVGYIRDKTNAERYRMRIVARRLPKEAIAVAMRRKDIRAKQRGRKKASASAKEMGQWQVLATSLGEEVPAQELFTLYAARWQIELAIKRFKQTLRIEKLPVSSEKNAKARVLLWLIANILAQRLLEQYEAELLPQERKAWHRVSLWQRHLLARRITDSIIGARLSLEGLPRSHHALVRHLSDHPRRRSVQSRMLQGACFPP